jgi:DNA polymerase-3 subunit delta
MAAAAKSSAPVVLVHGEDEFGVKQRSRQIYDQWTGELGGADHEIIDASASNSGEALKSLSRLREALQTLPFFGSGKVVWFQNCNFLGDERTAGAQAVTATLADLAQELKDFTWSDVRLLISAAKVDKRKVFFKTLDKIGVVESFAGWSADDADWVAQAEGWARREIQARQKRIDDETLADLVQRVGPNGRLLDSEIEKSPCMSACVLKLKRRTWRRFAQGIRRRGRLRWATLWATGTCPGCCAGSTRNFGRRAPTARSRRSASCMA